MGFFVWVFFIFVYMNRSSQPLIWLTIFITAFMLCKVQFIYAQEDIDSLKSELKRLTGHEHVDALNKIAKYLEYLSPDTSLYYAEKAASKAKEMAYINGEALSYLIQGNSYTSTSQYAKAKSRYKYSIELYSRNDNLDGLLKAFNNLGNMHRIKGEYDDALFNFLESMRISEQLNYKKGIAYASLNVGLIYSMGRVGNESDGLPYFEKALVLCKEIGDKKGIAYALNNLALIYMDFKDYDKALEYLLESVELKKADNDISGIASSYGNISDIYVLKEEYNNALEYTMKSIEYYRETMDENGEVHALLDAGKALWLSGNLTQSEKYLMQARELSEKTDALEVKRGTYLYLYEFYSFQEKYKDALHYYQLFTDVKDSIYSKESKDAIAEMNVLYETEKKEASIEKLENLTTIQELQLRKSQNTKWFFIITSILIFLLGAFIYYGYRQKQKANRLLTERNKFEIENKKRAISLFGQQVSKEVALELLSDSFKAGSKKLFACIMFLDIRNFTPYAEGKDPAEIIQYQNDVFGFMIDIISKHHGIINQFLGDGFMATFGAPVSSGNDCQNAVNTAIEIVNSLNLRIEKQQIPETKIGIGLHAGHIVTGNVGTEHRKQYSITGNTVILASRIEQLNKKYNSSILISKEVYEKLDDKSLVSEQLGKVELKGRYQPIELIRLI